MQFKFRIALNMNIPEIRARDEKLKKMLQTKG